VAARRSCITATPGRTSLSIGDLTSPPLRAPRPRMREMTCSPHRGAANQSLQMTTSLRGDAIPAGFLHGCYRRSGVPPVVLSLLAMYQVRSKLSVRPPTCRYACRFVSPTTCRRVRSGSRCPRRGLTCSRDGSGVPGPPQAVFSVTCCYLGRGRGHSWPRDERPVSASERFCCTRDRPRR
jgi:hypothetical protein